MSRATARAGGQGWRRPGDTQAARPVYATGQGAGESNLANGAMGAPEEVLTVFQALPGIIAILVPIISVIAVFTFVSIASFSDNKRREREAFYRFEFRKKLIEQSGANTPQVMELMQQEERAELRRRREGLKIGGFVTAAVGVGLIFGLRFTGEDVWMVGYIPLAIGVGLLLYGLFLAPQEPANPPSGPRPSA